MNDEPNLQLILPFDPAPPPGPEYRDVVPLLTAEEWKVGSPHRWEIPPDAPHRTFWCTGFGLNDRGVLLVQRQDSSVTMVPSKRLPHLAALALSKAPPFGWDDIHGM